VTGGAGGKTGGLVAANAGTFTPPTNMMLASLGGLPAATQGTVTHSYWDKGTTGQTTSAGGTGFNTADLSKGLPAGFDPNIWGSGNGIYPFLRFHQGDTSPGDQVKTQEKETNTVTVENQVIVTKDLVTNQNITTTTTTTEVVNIAAVTQQQTAQRAPQRTPQGNRPAARFPGQLDVGPGRYFVLPPPNETRLVKDEVVLQLPCNVDQQALDAVTRQMRLTVEGSQCLGTSNGLALYRMHINGGTTLEGVIRGLADYQIIAAAQANYTYQLMQDPDLSGTGREGDAGQYVLDKWRLPQVHRTLKGDNVTIGVIDSQVDITHPDLEGAITEQYNAAGTADKPHPHGTGMAGAIASHRKLMGIAPAAKIVAIHAFSSGASAESTTFNILKGLDWAVNNKIRIVNMSFAGPRDPSLERAIKVAHDKGVVMVAAAGNAGPKSPPLYPAADPNVIAVTATDIDDKLFTGANRGRYITVAAPGVDILVPAPEAAYQMTTGTSVATAHISGIVALLLERNPRLAPEDVRKILAASAKRLGPNNEFGAGLVDPIKALELAAPKTSAR
jgi:subtilisin family serine protease